MNVTKHALHAVTSTFSGSSRQCIRPIDIVVTPRERKCVRAVLAEKVAAEEKLGCLIRCLEFIFILRPQI